MEARIEVWKAANGFWYFHKRNRNGSITQPSQGYTRRANAVHAARRDIGDLPIVNPPARQHAPR